MKKRILLIDDEADIINLVSMRLETAGYKVLKAMTAEEALKMLKKEEVDLILLDLVLPNMQGQALCKKIKADDSLKKIPVIIFTACSTDVTDPLKGLCADDIVLKPFEPEDLLAKIAKLIGSEK